MQCVAVRCSALQCGAVRCSVLAGCCPNIHSRLLPTRACIEHIQTHYNTLQHTVTHCNTPQHTATHCNTCCIFITTQVGCCSCEPHPGSMMFYTPTYIHTQHTAMHTRIHAYKILQRAATHCNTLQNTATHCNTLQHNAVHCSTLQDTATQCIALQHTATRCDTPIRRKVTITKFTLHHTITHCNILPKATTRYHIPGLVAWRSQSRKVHNSETQCAFRRALWNMCLCVCIYMYI